MAGGATFDPDSVTIQKIDCTYPSGEPKFNVTLTMADGSTSSFSPDKEQVVKGLSVEGGTLNVSFNDGSSNSITIPSSDGKYVTGGSVKGNQLTLNYNSGGSADPITLPSSDGKYVTGGQVTGNQLTLNYNTSGTTTPITLPSFTDKYVTGGSVTGNQLTLNYNSGGSADPITLPKVVSDVTKDGENLIITYSDGTSNKFNLPAPKNDGVYKDGNGTWYYGDSNRVRKRLSTTGTNGAATGLNAAITGASLGCTAVSISTGGINWALWIFTDATAGFAGSQTGQKLKVTGVAEKAAASNLEQKLTDLKTEVSASVVATVKNLMGPLKTSSFGIEIK